MKHYLSPLALSLSLLIVNPADATALNLTTNASTIKVSGSVDDYSTGKHDGYTDGIVYTSTVIPFHAASNDYQKTVSISAADLSLDIAQITQGYKVWGQASSTANTAINSLDDNEAIASGEALVDLAFTLSTDFDFSFTSDFFNATGTGDSEVELINISTGIIFSQLFSEDSSAINFSGTLLAGDYTLFIGALSEAIDGDIASASVGYDLQLTSVPIPATLPLFFSGLIALGFKRKK